MLSMMIRRSSRSLTVSCSGPHALPLWWTQSACQTLTYIGLTMSLFCCTRPRSHSRPAPAVSVSADASISVKSFGPCVPRKVKHNRRKSKQDVEAFYQEGKQLQQEEELRELQDEAYQYRLDIINSEQFQVQFDGDCANAPTMYLHTHPVYCN